MFLIFFSEFTEWSGIQKFATQKTLIYTGEDDMIMIIAFRN